MELFESLLKFYPELNDSELKPIILEYLKDYKTIAADDNKGLIIIFSNETNQLYLQKNNDTYIFTKFIDENTIKRDTLTIKNLNPFVSSSYFQKRENGVLILKTEKYYGISRFSNTDKKLLDLVHSRKVYTKDSINKVFSKIDFENKNIKDLFRSLSLLSDKFFPDLENNLSLSMIYCSCKNYSKRKLINTIYSTYSRLNNNDISKIYGLVDGENKISRIFDLFMGIQTQDNLQDIKGIELGLIDQQAFNLYEKSGIKEKEEAFIGKQIKSKDAKLILN